MLKSYKIIAGLVFVLTIISANNNQAIAGTGVKVIQEKLSIVEAHTGIHSNPTTIPATFRTLKQSIPGVGISVNWGPNGVKMGRAVSSGVSSGGRSSGSACLLCRFSLK